jgi:hypothetical protein
VTLVCSNRRSHERTIGGTAGCINAPAAICQSLGGYLPSNRAMIVCYLAEMLDNLQILKGLYQRHHWPGRRNLRARDFANHGEVHVIAEPYSRPVRLRFARCSQIRFSPFASRSSNYWLFPAKYYRRSGGGCHCRISVPCPLECSGMEPLKKALLVGSAFLSTQVG